MKVLHVITGLEAGGAEIRPAMLLGAPSPTPTWLRWTTPALWPSRSALRTGTSVRDIGMRRNTELSDLLRLRSIIADGWAEHATRESSSEMQELPMELDRLSSTCYAIFGAEPPARKSSVTSSTSLTRFRRGSGFGSRSHRSLIGTPKRLIRY
jgi:hypothetical protein